MLRMWRTRIVWLAPLLAGIGYFNVHAARLQEAGGSARTPQTVAIQTAPTAAEERALLNQYCVTCHNQRLKTAGVMLDTADIEHLGEAPDTWEKVAHMLRTGAMPPIGRPRPEPAAYVRFAAFLEE